MNKIAGGYTYIDDGIRELVKELRELGYDTIESCAGHQNTDPDRPVYTYGWITFSGYYQVEPLVALFHKFGMSNVRVMAFEDGMEVRFNPVGHTQQVPEDDYWLFDYEKDNGKKFYTSSEQMVSDYSRDGVEVYNDN